MCGAGVEVVHPAGAAKGHLASDVEPVVAQAVVAGGVAVARRERFRGCAVSVARGRAPERPVRAPLVVVRAELVELALQLAERSRGRSRSQPALQRLVKALDLALGLGMSRRPVLLPDAEQRQEVFERVAAAAEASGVDAAVVCERRGRGAVLLGHA
jgi:hypothetical protein